SRRRGKPIALKELSSPPLEYRPIVKGEVRDQLKPVSFQRVNVNCPHVNSNLTMGGGEILGKPKGNNR
ncbi:unnamed protein product, partial [Allacma fusca]